MGLIQLIEHVTRPAVDKGTCIDWIITYCDYVSLSFVSNNLISEHFPVIAVHKKKCEFRCKEPKLIRLYKRLNLGVPGDIMTTLDWADFDNYDSP